MAEALADLVYRFRSAAKLSQEALAERAGVSARTISDLETGFAKTPRLVTILLIAEALSLDDSDRARLRAAVRKPPARERAEAPDEASSLPPLRPLVGRDTDAAAAGELLIAPHVRLVTLYGPAGVGKTSLAIRIAWDRRDVFADGVVFAEFTRTEDPAQILAVLAQTLGIADDMSGDVRDTVVARLRNRAMLLVLDNLEHLTPGAAEFAQLLDACPKITILATSREPLRLRAEHIFSVKPLEAAPAEELFIARARAVQPDFSTTESNRAALATIVARLDGLPLAIELAAPQLRSLPPKALAARLDRRLPMLEQGAVDLPERQQTMRRAIAWSYDLLSPDEQTFFRKLSELRGGSIDAVRAIATSNDVGESVLLSQIAALVDKSLLSLEEDADGEPRLTILEMLREFASEQLAGAERDETRLRHAAYFLELAERVSVELTQSGRGLTLRRLTRERANLVTALTWFDGIGDVERGLRLAFALSRFWFLRGHLTEGRTWLLRFLSAGDSTPAVSAQLRARGLRALVMLTSALGQFDDALPLCEEAISLNRQVGDDEGLAASLTSLGIIMQFRDDMARSKAAHEESLTIRRRIGDEHGLANSLSNLSSIAYTHGNLTDAARFAEESVAIHRRLGRTWGMSHALAKLGLVAAAQKEYELAERIFEESLAMQRSLGDDGAAFYSLSNLGLVALKRGNFEVALRRLREGLELLEVVANKAAMASTFEGIAAALNATGDSRRAARLLGAASALRDAIGAPLLPRESAEYDETATATRNAIGVASFEAEWRVGTLMGLERAVDEAAGRANAASMQ